MMSHQAAKVALARYKEIECVGWYRGLSSVQLEACNKLAYALRDDTAQGTVYRVLRCLTTLGLDPLVTVKQLKDIMRICRGSDLAFLMFVWEAYYKMDEDEDCREDRPYTVNEQLLLSAIAHLDLPATMRELDNILPPSSRSKKYQAREQELRQAREQQQAAEQRANQRRLNPQPRKEYVLPYFEPQPRPKPYRPAKAQKTRAHKVIFPNYKKKTPNEEEKRWFTKYKLRPGKRVVKRLLTEEFNQLFEEEGEQEAKEQTQTEEMTLCFRHRMLAELEKQRKQQLADEALVRCKNLFDVTGEAQRAQLLRTKRELEQQIECATATLNEYNRRHLTHVYKLANGSATSCQLCSVPAPLAQRKGQPMLALLSGAKCKPTMPMGNPLDLEQDTVIQLTGEIKSNARCGAGDCNIYDDVEVERKRSKVNISIFGVGSRISRFSQRSRRSNISKSKLVPESKPSQSAIRQSEIRRKSDFKPPLNQKCPRFRCYQATKPVEDESYTLKSSANYGVQLDYFKIFELPTAPPPALSEWDGEYLIEDKQPLIERFCFDALNKTMADEPEEERWLDTTELEPRRDQTEQIMDAAGRCARNLFKRNVLLRQEELRREEERCQDMAETVGRQSLRSWRKDGPCEVFGPVNPLDLEVLDADNKQQMIALLKAALDVLKANPYYVLASFPNAHKFPVLLDWVEDRYGKTYSDEEMSKMSKSAYYIYEMLERQQRTQKIPLKRNFGFKGQVTYTQRERFMCMVRRVRAKYNKQLNEAALEESRRIWLALRGFSNLSGAIDNAFFAYMPAREMDMKRQFPWSSHDFRDYPRIRKNLERRRAN